MTAGATFFYFSDALSQLHFPKCPRTDFSNKNVFVFTKTLCDRVSVKNGD